MDFRLSDEHAQFRATLRSFFEREAPAAVVAELDKGTRPVEPLFAGMAELGLLGMAFGEEHGGSGADDITLVIAVEEVGRASATLLYALMPTLTCSRSIALLGSEEQKRAILPEIAAGRHRLGLCLTEPNAGSDLTGLSTRAVRDGDDWVISGQKVFVTGADRADHLFVFTRTDPDASPSRGMTVLLVPRDADGISITPLEKLAGQGTHTCEVFLDDVRVPAEAVVGEVNRGMEAVIGVLDHERITNGAQSVGLAQGVLDLALAYAKERVQFGKAIIEQQAVAHMLADMAIEIEQARLLVYYAAWRLGEGLPCHTEASMAKVAGSEVGTRCASRGMQILGGYSYMVEYGMERYWREAKLNEIVAGTNEIQRNIIAKALGR